MKTETKPTHTPTPWKYTNGFIWSEAQKDRGAIRFGNENDETNANAAFIVRAVNAHEELLDLLHTIYAVGVLPKSKIVGDIIAKAEGL